MTGKEKYPLRGVVVSLNTPFDEHDRVDFSLIELHVSGGWASLQLLEALDRGVDAIMPTGMTGMFSRIFEAYARGEREQARNLYHKLLPVLAFTQQHLDISVQFYKRFFCHRGIFTTTKVRAPQILYDSAHERLAKELIEYLDQLDGWNPSSSLPHPVRSQARGKIEGANKADG